MPPTPTAPSVEYRHNVAGAVHELGVRVDGNFISFASLDDAYFDQLVENAENRAATAETAEEEEES